MKRLFSLIIALMLVFGMFAATTVAFAEPDDDESNTNATHEVEFKADEFKKNVFDSHPKFIEMSKTFMFGKDTDDSDDETSVVWFKDYAILHKIFEGINYIMLEDEKYEEGDDKYALTYDLKLSEAEDDAEATAAADEEDGEKNGYYATQKVKLDKAPAKDGYIFAGWTVEMTAKDGVEIPEEFTKDYRFPEGFEFNMPATEVKVTANWIEKVEEGETDKKQEEIPDMYANDILYVLYSGTADAKRAMDKWDRCDVTSTFSVTTVGPWAFRFAVIDGIQYTANSKTLDWNAQILATSYDNVQDAIDGGSTDEETLSKQNYTLYSNAQDTTAPEIKLSTAMEDKQETGLTYGTNYSVQTSLTIEDASSTKVTYVVYKNVGTKVEGADSEGWLQIYDSNTREVAEGYEKNISTSGVITPLKSDITDKYMYKIVYSVVDDYGYKGLTEDGKDYVELFLKVKNAPVTPGNITALEAWKIVLYVIAGLSAAGIVVLLCIKPKQAQATDARYNASAQDAADGSSDDGKQE